MKAAWFIGTITAGAVTYYVFQAFNTAAPATELDEQPRNTQTVIAPAPDGSLEHRWPSPSPNWSQKQP